MKKQRGLMGYISACCRHSESSFWNWLALGLSRTESPKFVPLGYSSFRHLMCIQCWEHLSLPTFSKKCRWNIWKDPASRVLYVSTNVYHKLKGLMHCRVSCIYFFPQKIAFHGISTLIRAVFLIFTKCIKKNNKQWELIAQLLVCVGKTSN